MPALTSRSRVTLKDVEILDQLKEANDPRYEDMRRLVWDMAGDGPSMSEPMLTQPGSFEGSTHHPPTMVDLVSESGGWADVGDPLVPELAPAVGQDMTPLQSIVPNQLDFIPLLEGLISDRAVEHNYPFTRSLARGAEQALSSVTATPAEWLGDLGTYGGVNPLNLGPAATATTARFLKDRLGSAVEERFGEPTELAQTQFADDPSIALNPAWLAEKGAEVIPSFVPGGIAGKAAYMASKGMAPAKRMMAAKAGFSGTAGVQEASGTYDSLIESGEAPSIAGQAAAGMGVGSAILNYIGASSWLTPKMRMRLANATKAYFVEGVTEGLEEFVDALSTAFATGDDVAWGQAWKNFQDAVLIAGPFGALGGGAMSPRLAPERNEALAAKKVKSLMNKLGLEESKVIISEEQLLDQAGVAQPGYFNPNTGNIHIDPRVIVEESDGTVSGIEAKAAERLFQEYTHSKTDGKDEALKAIYLENEGVIEAWIKQSPYNNDNLSDIRKADEWIGNIAEGDYKLISRVELGIKRLINEKISPAAEGKLWASTTPRVLAQDFINDVQYSKVEPTLTPQEETVDTSEADLQAAREDTQVQLTQMQEQLDSIVRDVTGDKRFAKAPVDIDKRRETAIAKATAPNEDIRYSDTRMTSVREDWKDNELDLRREYGNFEAFEQAEWDLNYDMWIDDIQAAELEDATQARVLQENILEEQLSGFERDFTGERRFAKKAAEMTEEELENRNFRNFLAKGPYKAITGEPQEEEIRARLKRLGNIFGPYGRRRGIDFPGGIEEARSQAQNAIDQVDVFERFIAPLEAQAKDKPAKSRTAEGRQEAYAARRGITISDILKYRERGKIHPMEKKMSYTFGMEEINRLEQEGEIRPEEAEARRRTLRDLQNELAGRLPPGARRKATEIVFGIGDYANIEPWRMTEEEVAATTERADLAKAQERVTGTRRAAPTEQQAAETLEADITAEEAAQISMMTGSELFDNLKTDEARVTFLREEEAMPAIERDALNEFKRDPQAYDEAVFLARRKEDQDAQVAEAEVTIVEQTPAQRKAELKEMKEAQAPIEKRKHIQVEPDFFETLEDPMFTIQGESIPEGFTELTEEGDVAEVESDIRFAKKSIPASAFPGMAELESFVEGEQGAFLEQDVGEWFEHNTLGPGKIMDVNPEAFTVLFAGDYSSRVFHQDKVGMFSYVDSGIQELERQLVLKRSLSKRKKTGRTPAQIQDTLNRKAEEDPQQVDITKSELRHLSSMKKLGTALNRYLPKTEGNRVRASLEHIRNITPFKIKDGQSTGEPLHAQDKPFKRRTKNTKDNLIFMGATPDILKTKFEKKVQSTRPYQDMYDMTQKGLDTGLTQEQAENVFIWRMTSQDALRELKETGKDITPKDLATVIQKADAAIGEVYELNEADLSDMYVDQGTIDTVVDVMLNKFDTSRPQSTEATTDGAANELVRYAKRAKGESYEEHFNKNFWYTLTSYLWGKPVQSIRDFNKISRFGQAKADVPAADEIADEIQRAHSSTQRAEPLVYGTDIVQDTSIKTGQFYTRLSQIFSRVTARLGDVEKRENTMLVDVLTGKLRVQELDSAKNREAGQLLRDLIQDVYNYAKNETKHLKKPLDLRGHGDTLLPRVWNIEFLATRRGKAKFLKAIRAAISDPATGSSILEDADLTVEDLYNVVVNSGGFVQGDWTNLKADQTRDQKEIDRDLKAQEYLDALPTESLIDEDLVMIDLQAIIPRFIQKAVERTEYSKRFGVNDELLRQKIKEGLDQIKAHNAKVLKLDKTDQSLTYIDPKAFEKSVWDMARILRNKYGYDMANMQTRAWLQRLVNFQVVAKLPLVTLASMPELFTPMLRGDVRADKWVVDFMMGLSWAGYKGMNGISKLLLNKHLPAMRKMSKDIGGVGVVSDMQLLRELGIAEIQAMGDAVSTRYANPNFARGGLRAGARTTLAGRVPKKVRAVFNMQTYMQATLLTTLTEMQQLMALRNFQRHMAKRVKFVQKNAGKDLKGRRLRLFKQFSKDMADFGLPQNIDLNTPGGEAEFNAGAIRFVDQVITRPNDATTAKAFKNPLTAPIFLFKRFITTFGNTLMTAVGNDIATKVSNVEKAKQVGRILGAVSAMYGAVMFAEIMRAVIKGDLDEDDMTLTGGDFRTFVRRVDRTGLLSAPGAMVVNLSFPFKRGWWDSPEARIWGEFGGPIGGDLAQLMKTGFDDKAGWRKLVRQIVPMSKQLIELPPKKKRKKKRKDRW